MDPISQGVVGMTASQVVATRKEVLVAGLLGFLSGMAADLDVFIHSTEDPLLFLEFHRQFTHSIIFIPFGALICTTFFWFFFKSLSKKQTLPYKRIYLYSFAGYASHALLDSCTSYGTQLYWPFSNERVAWNTISIIDPLFTIPLILILAVATFRRSRNIAIIAASYGLLYLSLGFVQENRANTAAQLLASNRGHQPINITVKPSFMNLVIWKSVYEHSGRYYVDAIRVLNTNSYFEGSSTPVLNITRDLHWLDGSSQQARDIERFRWFSANNLAIDPNDPNRIIDIRYSMLPNRMDGLWGIILDPAADKTSYVKWSHNPNKQDKRKNITKLWSMLIEQGKVIK